MITARNTVRKSEGSASARRLLEHTSRAQMPQPLLLTPATNGKAPQLRLIKPARAGLSCGYGTCSLTPECTGTCRYSQADESLRSHYNSRHTQRQAMPDVRTARDLDTEERRDRRMERRLAIGVLVVFLLAIAAPFGAGLLSRFWN